MYFKDIASENCGRQFRQRDGGTRGQKSSGDMLKINGNFGSETMKHLVIANWKANPSTLAEAKKLFLSIKKGLGKRTKAEVVICPPFVYLSDLVEIAGPSIKLGAQDVFSQEGAFTGQVSAQMLKSLACKYVIIGHSERRAMGETDEMVNRKIKAVISAKLSPILCIGESREQKRAGETKEVLEKQLSTALKNISKLKIYPVKSRSPSEIVPKAISPGQAGISPKAKLFNRVKNSKLTIAYEPIWAIGPDNACDTDTAMTIKLLIRKILTGIYNRAIAQNTRILYGGSVNSSIVEGYIKESIMDGVLVGGASLNPKEFIAILSKF